jgi:hypothetical protein
MTINIVNLNHFSSRAPLPRCLDCRTWCDAGFVLWLLISGGYICLRRVELQVCRLPICSIFPRPVVNGDPCANGKRRSWVKEICSCLFWIYGLFLTCLFRFVRLFTFSPQSALVCFDVKHRSCSGCSSGADVQMCRCTQVGRFLAVILKCWTPDWGRLDVLHSMTNESCLPALCGYGPRIALRPELDLFGSYGWKILLDWLHGRLMFQIPRCRVYYLPCKPKPVARTPGMSFIPK